jgi:hypothetical protein
MVEVVSSSDPDLQMLADSQRLMVYFEFRDYLAGKKPKFVEYIRNGRREKFVLAEVSAPNELLSLNPYLLRKFFNFRTINKEEPQNCVH